MYTFQSIYKLVILGIALLIFMLLSSPLHAGGIKIIIGGYDGYGDRYYSGHNEYYRFYDKPKRHRLYNKHYFDSRAYQVRKFNRGYYRNKHYGYRDYYRPRNSIYYRNYCPY